MDLAHIQTVQILDTNTLIAPNPPNNPPTQTNPFTLKRL